MADDLDLRLRSIEGEGPSPEFVATLRERVLAEATPTVATDGDAVVEITPRDEHEKERSMTKTRWMLAAAAAATLVLIAGIVVVTGDSDTVKTDTPPDSTAPATTAPAATTTEPPTTTEPTATDDAEPFGAGVERLPSSFTGLEPGPYWTDTLAVPFSFEIDQSLFVQENRSVLVALSSPASRDPGDKGMDFLPLPALWNPGQVGLDGEASAAELIAHLESLSGRVVLSNRADVTLDGRDAIRFDIAVDTSSCGADTEPCADVARNESGLYQSLGVGWQQRIWVIDLGDELPMAIVASIWTDRDAVWLDVVERYVSTLAFADT